MINCAIITFKDCYYCPYYKVMMSGLVYFRIRYIETFELVRKINNLLSQNLEFKYIFHKCQKSKIFPFMAPKVVLQESKKYF